MIKRKHIFLVLITIPAFLLLVSNVIVEQSAKGKTYSNVSEIKKSKVGLVLGTSKHLSSGAINPYFQGRIDAAVELIANGKVDFLIVSGDNGTENYDEPTDFKRELVKRGTAEKQIFLDYAGFRTLDSVVRAKEIFGQKDITIISQRFHNERAIYLARHYGIDAVGFNAKDVPSSLDFKTQIREYFARTKAFLDIMMNVQPKFLGEPIKIE